MVRLLVDTGNVLGAIDIAVKLLVDTDSILGTVKIAVRLLTKKTFQDLSSMLPVTIALLSPL